MSGRHARTPEPPSTAGTLAERPEAFGQILIYLVIPETLIIFGFVIAFFLNNQIGG